jgi:hypothetical protein
MKIIVATLLAFLLGSVLVSTQAEARCWWNGYNHCRYYHNGWNHGYGYYHRGYYHRAWHHGYYRDGYWYR